MTNNIRHFIGPLKPINNGVVKFYGGVINIRGEGTVKCKIEESYGQIHSIIVHRANYVPEATICLLSPQQLSQQAADNHLKPDVTWCATKAKKWILYLNQEMYKRTICWYACTSTRHIRSAPSNNTHLIIVASIEEDLNSEDK